VSRTCTKSQTRQTIRIGCQGSRGTQERASTWRGQPRKKNQNVARPQRSRAWAVQVVRNNRCKVPWPIALSKAEKQDQTPGPFFQMARTGAKNQPAEDGCNQRRCRINPVAPTRDAVSVPYRTATTTPCTSRRIAAAAATAEVRTFGHLSDFSERLVNSTVGDALGPYLASRVYTHGRAAESSTSVVPLGPHSRAAGYFRQKGSKAARPGLARHFLSQAFLVNGALLLVASVPANYFQSSTCQVPEFLPSIQIGKPTCQVGDGGKPIF